MHNFLGIFVVFQLVFRLASTHFEQDFNQYGRDSELVPEGSTKKSGVHYSIPVYEPREHSTRKLSHGYGRWRSPDQPVAADSEPEKTLEETSFDTSSLQLVPDWPDSTKKLGQLSAVSFDSGGNVVVFHRGDRVWGDQTFLANNVFNQKELGPIRENTVVVFNSSGHVVQEWGSNIFYLPHGLTVDAENNVWVTDVALHQVMKFTAGGKLTALVLGTALVPGRDDAHFCKPTDVAVESSGEFFVSDGYCNARIIKYSKTGQKLLEWGRPTPAGARPGHYSFFVPHALALIEEKHSICVADRENGRIVCFNSNNGTYITELQSERMGSRVFSVAYSPNKGGLIYTVNGPGMVWKSVPVRGFVFSASTLQPVAEFSPDSGHFDNPHDVAVSKDGSEVVVVELNPFKVWKFVKDVDASSTPESMKNSKSPNEVDTAVTSANFTGSQQQNTTAKKPLVVLSNANKVKDSKEAASSGPSTLRIILSGMAVLAVLLIVGILWVTKRGGCHRRRRENFDDYSKLMG